MRKTKIREAIERLEELKEAIYETIDEMEEILKEIAPIAPNIYAMSKSYWLAHIDGALENRGQWLGEASLISYIDTIDELEEMMESEGGFLDA